MIQARKSVFETNSSSVHSMTMCLQSEYDRWVAGELLYEDYSGFVTIEEAHAKVEKYREKYNPDRVGKPITEDELNSHKFYSHDAFWDKKEEYYDSFSESYNGVVAFGYYGHD